MAELSVLMIGIVLDLILLLEIIHNLYYKKMLGRFKILPEPHRIPDYSSLSAVDCALRAKPEFVPVFAEWD